MSLLRFDGRVALITGAGRGLGREYALLLAKRGAKIVVNDLGGDSHGGGKGSQAADEVVHQIKQEGGVAVPNYDSVEDGDRVVKTAIDSFGRLDIVINNAGVLRDRSLLKMTDKDWDIVQAVHMKGAFKVTRAAFPYMRQQQYGRIIMTSSPSGLYGNFGQANYSAAKLGLVGFSNTVSKEGAKHNINCNVIAPSAWSRMSADVMPPNFESLLKVEYIAPIVTYLCHESCTDNGTVIESAGGWAGKVRLQKSTGVVLKKPFTIEDVRDNWSAICDMSNPLYHENNRDTIVHLLGALQGEDAGAVDVDGFIGKTIQSVPFTFTSRDVILYALGVGTTLTREDTSDLQFLYEGHPDFCAIPSYAVLPAQVSAMHNAFSDGIPGIKEFNLAQALHGEQYVELKRPMPTSGTLISEGRIADVVDKKSGALVLVEVDTKTEDGEPVCFNQFAIFIIGAGGFGGKTTTSRLKPTVRTPNRAPDVSKLHKTHSNQAALYRLSGDYNPLHVDGDFAKLGGFDTPILHGMCSYGIATRHIMKQYCNNDPSKVKAIKARFSKPVLPGHTIQTDMWHEGTRIHFICKALETGDVVLSGGYIDLHDVVEVGGPAQASAAPPADGLASTAIFEELKKHVAASPEFVKKVNAIFLWKITKDGQLAATWTVDLKNAPGSIYSGEPTGEKPGCTLALSDDDFQRLVNGKLNPQQAFMQGKFKITGNIMLTQKLQTLFSAQAKL